MIDMWFMNSVTFIYSHCFIIVGFECIYIALMMVLVARFDRFFAVESTSETPDVLVTVNLVLFAVATHVMLYNMNVLIKLNIMREKQ